MLFPTDLVTFTEETLNRKFHFFYSAMLSPGNVRNVHALHFLQMFYELMVKYEEVEQNFWFLKFFDTMN